MPIDQEKHVNLLKAGAYYRMAYQKLFDQIQRDYEKASKGELTLPLRTDLVTIYDIMKETTNNLNPTYGQYIEAGLQYYTPAKLKENERVKEWLKRKRDEQQPNRKRRTQQRIIDDNLPTPQFDNIDVGTLPQGVTTRDINRILAQMGADPIEEDVWPPPGTSLKEE